MTGYERQQKQVNKLGHSHLVDIFIDQVGLERRWAVAGGMNQTPADIVSRIV